MVLLFELEVAKRFVPLRDFLEDCFCARFRIIWLELEEVARRGFRNLGREVGAKDEDLIILVGDPIVVDVSVFCFAAVTRPFTTMSCRAKLKRRGRSTLFF